jgi:hypothetical protein
MVASRVVVSTFLFALAALGVTACGRSRAARINLCVHALDEIGDSTDSTEAGRRVAEACAPLYSKAACRDGMLEAWAPKTDPWQRVHIMVEACRSAYCPELADPKPALCTDFSFERSDFARLS